MTTEKAGITISKEGQLAVSDESAKTAFGVLKALIETETTGSIPAKPPGQRKR
jgi:hypothetical protein